MKSLQEIGAACEMVKLSIRGRIAILTISRPEALNALNNQTLKELERLTMGLECARDIWG